MPMRSRRVRRASGSRRTRTRRSSRRTRSSGRVSFAAKLGAFILQGLGSNTSVQWSLENGFSNKQTQVSGVLPFLHLNISENQLRALLRGSHGNHVRALTSLCNTKDLNTRLRKVNFNCRKQSNNGITGLEDALIVSINNSWNMRATGRRHLATVARLMRKQVDLNIIKPASVVWANGL